MNHLGWVSRQARLQRAQTARSQHLSQQEDEERPQLEEEEADAQMDGSSNDGAPAFMQQLLDAAPHFSDEEEGDRTDLNPAPSSSALPFTDPFQPPDEMLEHKYDDDQTMEDATGSHQAGNGEEEDQGGMSFEAMDDLEPQRMDASNEAEQPSSTDAEPESSSNEDPPQHLSSSSGESMPLANTSAQTSAAAPPPAASFAPSSQPQTLAAQMSQLVTSAESVDRAVVKSVLDAEPKKQVPRVPSAIELTMFGIAERIVASTSSSATAKDSNADGAPPSLSSTLSLPIPLLIAHLLDESIATSDRNATSLHGSVLTIEFIVGLGKKLGDALMQGSTLLHEADLQRLWQSVSRAIDSCILTADVDASLERRATAFLRSLGFACPPLLLYCLLHSLDQHLTVLQPGGAGSASADAASDLPLTVPALDFLEHSYHLVHLLDTILAHHQSTTASSAAASSASTPVCQSRLNCFGMDWRQVWQQRFVCHWLQSTTLALIHPMLLECLWRIFGATKMQTQAIEGFKLDGTMQEDAGAPAAAAASA